MINRREALLNIGQGIAAVGGFSLITVPPKKGMSDFTLTMSVDNPIFRKAVDSIKQQIPVKLVVITTNKHDYFFDSDVGEYMCPLYHPETTTKGQQPYDPAYNFCDFVKKLIEYKCEHTPSTPNLTWFLIKNPLKEKVGMCVGETLRIPGERIKRHNYFLARHGIKQYIEEYKFYPKYEWWNWFEQEI